MVVLAGCSTAIGADIASAPKCPPPATTPDESVNYSAWSALPAPPGPLRSGTTDALVPDSLSVIAARVCQVPYIYPGVQYSEPSPGDTFEDTSKVYMGDQAGALARSYTAAATDRLPPNSGSFALGWPYFIVTIFVYDSGPDVHVVQSIDTSASNGAWRGYLNYSPFYPAPSPRPSND